MITRSSAAHAETIADPDSTRQWQSPDEEAGVATPWRTLALRSDTPKNLAATESSVCERTLIGVGYTLADARQRHSWDDGATTSIEDRCRGNLTK